MVKYEDICSPQTLLALRGKNQRLIKNSLKLMFHNSRARILWLHNSSPYLEVRSRRLYFLFFIFYLTDYSLIN